MLMSPSMSIVVAGVASGICFLIYCGIIKGKPGDSKQEEKQLPLEENRCSCCLRPFFLGRGVRCKDCGAKSCRKGCSRWDASDNAWHCLFCHQQRYWLTKNKFEAFGASIDKKDLHRYFNTAKSRVHVAGVENAATSSGYGLAAEKEEANAMETVRDFVEKIVEGLIGNVDDTPINRLYDHPAYDKFLEIYITPLVDALTRLAVVLRLSLKNKPNADSPTMAHTALREIVERAMEEARKLPGLGGSGGTGRALEGRNIAENSYEDLLATAILNKVIEKFQKEQVDGNSNVLPGKPVSGTKCTLSESEAGLDEGVEEGCSSLEPLSQDDCSSNCSASCARRVRNQSEPLSLTIEERIEEVTTTYASDEDPRENDVPAIKNTHRVPFPELGMDIIDPSQESEDSQDEPDTPTTHIGLVSPVESWEENWLFQRKRVQTQADPVAMLVPNPSADFKALIGDKDAEDTSDLSECSSAQSDEEIEKELMEAINNVVPRSPKRRDYENGVDHYSSEDVSFKETYTKSSDSKIEENSNSRTEAETNRIERNGDDQNGETKAKEMKEKETEDEKSVPELIGVISKDSKKIGTERETRSEQFEEDKTEELTKVPSETVRSEFLAEDSSNSNLMEPSTVALPDENVLYVPKTPATTPTRISMAEISLENVNNEKTLVSREENVLNSLERAKRKLMEVNEDTVEMFKEEEAKYAEQKADFHAEDIQQESEYTEHYDIATQRHLDSLTKTESFEPSMLQDSSSTESTESKCREAVALAKAESASHLSLQNKKSEEDVQLAAPPRPGTIAEREHKKWENAPPIENNPYSQENIQKRLWQRQYSRRHSSDIPGIHTELPKSNGADLDVVLTPHEPDIKRFGRDYYINDSRGSSNEKGRRSAASTSSRPSSSLSQRSSSTGMADQDQQVSFQLEKFEETSLRSSLSRRTYRDSYSSPHFAINPLLHMELDESANSIHEKTELPNEQSITTENNIQTEIKYTDSMTENDENLNEHLNERFNIHEQDNESLAMNDNISKEPRDFSFILNERKIAYNPLYEAEGNSQKPDEDSGIYSVHTNDLKANKKQNEENWRRLWTNEWQNIARNDQILSSNGKKYWNFGGYKYHTFGGIKSSLTQYLDESDEDQLKPETPNEFFDIADFGKLKFQTFGGIKNGKKVDGKGIPLYKRTTLRSSIKNYKNTKGTRSTQSDSIVENGNESAYEYESEDSMENDETIPSKISTNFSINSKRKYKTKLAKTRPKTLYSSSYRSSSIDEDDDWQDEDVHVSDKVIMRKFLRDATKKIKSRPNSDNDSTYFVNTSRRRVFVDDLRRTRSQKQLSLDDNESLKLEPPIVPEVFEKTFETLEDLRGKTKRKKHKEPNKKLGVRCLSDLTIWMHDRCENLFYRSEETQYKETESILNRSNDVKTKVAKWQNNNVENKYQSPVRQTDTSNEVEKGKEKYSKKIEKSWEDQRMEELLENERKNSKNEINAKLNNQENYENAVIETRKSNSDGNPRKIKRIDLKAYGFENEFFSNRTIKTSTPRVVNKLDLKSFGYDDGIRRTQSNIQLNSIGNDEFKPSFIRMPSKSNLTRRNDYDTNRRGMIESTRASGDSNLTQSTEALNKFENDSYNDFGLKSAKSVPNIAKFYSNTSNEEDEEIEDYNQNSYNEIGMIKNGSVKNIANNYKMEKCNIKNSESSNDDESENETDVSSEREQSSRSISDNTKRTLSDEEFDNKVLPMPSVRRLAEAFSKQTDNTPAPISKITKSSNVYKERSSTPEIQIVETPRQMHSLTARSLSKQFREGLRQIPNKVTSPPASHVTMEQQNIPENQTEVIAAKGDNVSNDTNVILPGKLKSNIIFWEQMQKKN
ncbi:hypothetical protein ANTQUA_LOCUS7767, partial [Anthophora quadrimaculata]